MDNNKYGILLTPAIKLHRRYFEEMLKLIGINVVYRAPKPSRHWTTYAEINTNYEDPINTGCIFQEHPEQQTMKKLGWLAELQDSPSLIDVPYDLPGIQNDALFIIPSGLDNAPGRVFRVVKMTTSITYPAAITCAIVPEYEDTFSPSTYNYKHSSMTLLAEEDDHL